jgi:hypothetical protein
MIKSVTRKITDTRESNNKINDYENKIHYPDRIVVLWKSVFTGYYIRLEEIL